MAKYDILLIGDGTNLLKTIGWVLDYKGFASQGDGHPGGRPGSHCEKEL